MVIYGYGRDIAEQDELEAETFRSAWKAEESRIYKTLSGEDRYTLIEIILLHNNFYK